MPFDCKCQNLQTSFCTFLIFAKVWPVQTIVTDTQAHRNGQAHSYRRNHEYLSKNTTTAACFRQKACTVILEISKV